MKLRMIIKTEDGIELFRYSMQFVGKKLKYIPDSGFLKRALLKRIKQLKLGD